MLQESLRERLARELQGELLTDDFSRALFANDASHYQILPSSIVVPKQDQDLNARS